MSSSDDAARRSFSTLALDDAVDSEAVQGLDLSDIAEEVCRERRERSSIPPPSAPQCAFFDSSCFCVLFATLLGSRAMRAAQIFSLDAWRRLSAEERSKLTAMLPESCQESEADVEHVLQTELFSLQPRRFGAPLARFWNDLKAGAYSAASFAAAERADAERARAHISLRRQHHNALVHKLHQLTRTWKPRAPRAPSKSSGGGGKASDQLLYDKQSGGPGIEPPTPPPPSPPSPLSAAPPPTPPGSDCAELEPPRQLAPSSSRT